MNRSDLVAFVRERGLAVVATTGPQGEPQAALVGVACTDQAEIIFDTLTSSRKYRNIQSRPEVAVVIGWDDEVTVQCQGAADILTSDDLTRCTADYFKQCPEGRDRAADPNIAHVRIRPRWVRFSDFRLESFSVEELQLPEP
jgi:PPOX class probable F420-dependent enzyme